MAIDLPPAVETIVVQPARLPPAAGDVAFSIVQIDAQSLQAQPLLDEALTSTPGVSLFRRTSSLARPTRPPRACRCAPSPPPAPAAPWSPSTACRRTIPFGGWVIWSALPPGGRRGRAHRARRRRRPLRRRRPDRRGRAGRSARPSPAASRRRLRRRPATTRRAAAVGRRRLGREPPVRSAPRPSTATAGSPSARARGAADTRPGLDAIEPRRPSPDARSARPSLAVRGSRLPREARRRPGASSARARKAGPAASPWPRRRPTQTRGLAPAGLGARAATWPTARSRSRPAAPPPPRPTTSTPPPPPATASTPPCAGPAATCSLGARRRRAHHRRRGPRALPLPGRRLHPRREAGGKTLVGGAYAEASRTSGPWLVTGGVRLDYWRSSDACRDRARPGHRRDDLSTMRPADKSAWCPPPGSACA